MIAGHLGLVDTGAINGMMGVEQYLDFDQNVLKQHALRTVEITSPVGAIGGVGGKATVCFTMAVPVGLGGIPGVLSVVVIEGSVPTLIPVGLMTSLKAHIRLDEDTIRWSAHPDATSSLTRLPSGHIAVDMSEGLENFAREVPDAAVFRRDDAHERFIARLQDKLGVRQCNFALDVTLGEDRVTSRSLSEFYDLLGDPLQPAVQEPCVAQQDTGDITAPGLHWPRCEHCGRRAPHHYRCGICTLTICQRCRDDGITCMCAYLPLSLIHI